MAALARILCLALALQVCSGFMAPVALPLRGAPTSCSMRLRQAPFSLSMKGDDVVDVNPAGEERHHPYYDAPEEAIAKAGRLHVNEPPPEPNADFSRNHPDFDAPVEKQLAAGHITGKGTAAAKADIEPAFFDAPLDKVAAAGNLHVNEAPPDVKADFKRNHPDFDAPVDRQIAANNIVPSEYALTVTPTGDETSTTGPFDIHETVDDTTL